jgi:hypothetical protein
MFARYDAGEIDAFVLDDVIHQRAVEVLRRYRRGRAVRRAHPRLLRGRGTTPRLVGGGGAEAATLSARPGLAQSVLLALALLFRRARSFTTNFGGFSNFSQVHYQLKVESVRQALQRI